MSVKLQPGLGKTQPPQKKIPDGAGSKLDEVRLRAYSQSPIDTKVIFTSKTLYLWRHVLKCSLFWMRFNAFSLQEYMCSPTPCSTSILLQPQAALVTKGQQIKEQNINQGLRGLVISGTASLHVSLLKSFSLSCRSFLLGWNVPVAIRTSAEVPILCIWSSVEASGHTTIATTDRGFPQVRKRTMPRVWLVLESASLRNWRDTLKRRHWGCNTTGMKEDSRAWQRG